jgi:hypothetical protein
MSLFGTMPVQIWWPRLAGGAWRLGGLLLLLAVLWWSESVVSSSASFPSTKNKLGVTSHWPVFPDLAAMDPDGGERWGDLEFLGWLVKLLLAKCINNSEVASRLCSANGGTLCLRDWCSDGSHSSRLESQIGGSSSTMASLRHGFVWPIWRTLRLRSDGSSSSRPERQIGGS